MCSLGHERQSRLKPTGFNEIGKLAEEKIGFTSYRNRNRNRHGENPTPTLKEGSQTLFSGYINLIISSTNLKLGFNIFSNSTEKIPNFESLKIINCIIIHRKISMMPRWSGAVAHLRRAAAATEMRSEIGGDFSVTPCRSFTKVAAVEVPATPDPANAPAKSQVNLNKLFWSKPRSLALPPGSPQRIDEPNYEGIRRIILKLLLFYSKQSISIRRANVIYKRVVSQVDNPGIYNAFNLEKTFNTTFTLLVLHMWLSLRRLKEEGETGVELGQYVYEIYNHDLELRVSKAGVNLLLSKWMKELEKIFYGNIVAYDAAMQPDAKQDDLQNVIWKNIFSGDGLSKPDDAALRAVQAFSRYVRLECSSLSLTDKEAVFSGNFLFTDLENLKDMH